MTTMPTIEEIIEDSSQLPALQWLADLEMECDDPACKYAARQIAKYCGHKINIAHQRMNDLSGNYYYQIVIWHGGEALYIRNTYGNNLNSDPNIKKDAKEWIDSVHKYSSVEDTNKSQK